MTTIRVHASGEREVHIDCSTRTSYQEVTDVCDPDGYIRFGIDPKQVDECVLTMMGVIQYFKPDVVVTAIGIMFLLTVWRFGFKMGSYLRFIENYLHSSTEKLGCHAAQRMIHTLYESKVARKEIVKFNHTRSFMLPEVRQELPEDFQS